MEIFDRRLIRQRRDQKAAGYGGFEFLKTEAFSGETSTAQLARSLSDLVDYLCRANHFPDGAALATGTGIVPELDFTLQPGDVVEIEIDDVGRLVNTVAMGKEPFAWLNETGANER